VKGSLSGTREATAEARPWRLVNEKERGPRTALKKENPPVEINGLRRNPAWKPERHLVTEKKVHVSPVIACQSVR